MSGPPGPPQFLAGTVSTISFRRRAGEWDLVLEREPKDGDAIELVLSAFYRAFQSWVAFRDLVVRTDQGDVKWPGNTNVDDWLEEVRQRVAASPGFEASLDLDLAWADQGGGSGEARFAKSAALWFDRTALTSTFSIYPNLFTDVILVYEAEDGGLHRGRPQPFTSAARLNRGTLSNSLRTWVDLTGGRIASWSSELVDGVGQHGFEAGAKPRAVERG